MALNFAQMLLQPTKATPWDLSPSGGGTAREQLKLARERFAWEQKQAEEQRKLDELKLRGDAARAAALAEKERLDREAEVQAKLLAQQQGAVQKFGELAGSGKVQQAQAMAPYFDQLGYDMSTLGNVGGLPVFELQNRAQETERQKAEQAALASGDEMAGLGYPTNERGTLDDPGASRAPTLTDERLSLEPGAAELDAATTDALTPGDADMATAAEFGGDEVADVSVGRGMMPGSLSAGDAYAQALAASQAARDSGGRPVRGRDEEDWQGAVPRNVIDLPAMQAETLARLSPALKARVGALPEELQPGAEANAAAIGGLGLEASDALKEMDTALEDPVSIYNQKLNIQAQKEKESRLTPMDVSLLRTRGAEQAQKLAEKRGVSNILSAVKSADVALSVLDDDDPNNDTMIAPALMDAQGVKGVPSNTDLAYSLGMSKASTITQIISKIEELIVGGMSKDQKNAIKKYLRSVQESQKGTVDDYLNSAYGRLDSGELQSDEARGYKGAVEESVPAWMHNDYWDKREKARGGQRGAAGQSAPAGDAGDAAGELQRQAGGAGLNGQLLGQLMGVESGGKTTAANSRSSAKGVFQLIDSTAQDMGFKDAADYAAQPLDKQIEVGLKLFKNKGLTAKSSPEDYALVLAAPSLVGKWKSRDDVVYKKGSDEWNKNAPWRPAGGGDITVGSIADAYLAKGEAPAEKASGGLPEPKTPAEKRIVELVKKRGG